MDPACMPALARIGYGVLPVDLRDRLRRLDELEREEAERARADLDLYADIWPPLPGIANARTRQDPAGLS